VVTAGDESLLIDAGLSAQTVASRCKRLGVSPETLRGILLTHEHHDHSCGAGIIARRYGIPILANEGTLNACAERDTLTQPNHILPTGEAQTFGAFGVQSFPIPHNAAEPVGYTLTIGGCKIFYATDVGSVTPDLMSALSGANLIILEANHDLQWLLHGSYSPEMKARVASPIGHLSNAECGAALAKRLEEGTPCTIWLAHLSRMNNSPALAKRTVLACIGKSTATPYKLEVALRDQPSLTWRYGSQAHQLNLL
jgi:phosphoribosyl 1,2-cyclic phosphodiesterase